VARGKWLRRKRGSSATSRWARGQGKLSEKGSAARNRGRWRRCSSTTRFWLKFGGSEWCGSFRGRWGFDSEPQVGWREAGGWGSTGGAELDGSINGGRQWRARFRLGNGTAKLGKRWSRCGARRSGLGCEESSGGGGVWPTPAAALLDSAPPELEENEGKGKTDLATGTG